MRWLGCVAIIICFYPGHCQIVGQKRLDSLQRVASEHKGDTLGIDARNKLAEEYVRKDLGRARKYLYEAIEIARNLKTSHGLSNSYSQLTTSYQDSGQPDSARYYLMQLEKLFLTNTHDRIINSNYNLTAGLYYKRQGNYKTAISYMLAALEFMKRNEASRAGQLLNIGNTYFLLGKLKSAADYHLNALREFEALGIKLGQSFCFQSLGEDMLELKQYKASEDYFLKSLKLKEELNDERGRVTAWRGLGKVNRETNRYEPALSFLNQSLAKAKDLKLTLEESNTLNEIAMLYANRNDNAKARKYFDESLRLAKVSNDSLMIARINAALIVLAGPASGAEAENVLLKNIFKANAAGDNRSLPDAYFGMAKWYADHKQYEKAFQQLQHYIVLNDNLRGRDVLLQLKELEARYQSDKKESEIQVLTAKNEINDLQIRQQAVQRNYLIGLIFLFLVLIGVLYNRYTIKQKASRKLEEIDHLKSKFFANISHEFRTPLSLIIGPLQKSIDLASPPGENDVALMHRNAERLHTLIDQMLDLARIESRSMQLHISAGPLGHFIKTIFSAFSSLADQRRIKYSLEMRGNLEYGYFDSDKLEKILYNLISNAFKFTTEGGEITVDVDESNERMTVRVIDSGIGIPAEHVEKVFDRFYQVDDSNAPFREGTGIGLALSKELAEIHIGTVTVSSSVGKGSVFQLTIPVGEKAYRHLTTTNGQAQSGHFTPPSFQTAPELFQSKEESEELPLVLVVEDNPDMRLFIVDTLGKEYRTEAAHDGRDGWEKAKALVPDVIVSDIMMPRLDGKEFCNLVKSTTATSHIPVILLTARADRESKVDGLGVGADDYLTKPFDGRELRIRIHNLVEQREKLKRLFSQRVTLQPKDILLPDSEAGFINKLMAVVEEKFSDSGFGVEEFTLEIGLSRMQLHRKLKALTGQSTGEFLRHFRLERAKQLLTGKGMQVGEVAFQCGFASVSHFAKVFKEFTGVTPGGYSPHP